MFSLLNKSLGKASTSSLFSAFSGDAYMSISRGFQSSSTRLRSGYTPSGPSYQNVRATANYTIFGDQCMLSLKLLPPTFRNESGYLYLDQNKRGRLILEWKPRNSNNKFSKENALRFGLTAEEVGMIISQLPEADVELYRKGQQKYDMQMSGSVSDMVPDKILRIIPGNNGTVLYKIDLESGDGGSNDDPYSSTGATTPLEVVVQLGEQVVISELMRYSIPILTGWATMSEMSLQNDNSNSKNRDDYIPF